MKVILGSASPRRKLAMDSIGTPYEVLSADIDERSVREADPEKLTLALAKAKANALLRKIKEPAILITADLVVVFNGTILEKPENPEQARQFLKSYSHTNPETVAAVAVTNTQTGKQVSGVNRATVIFRQIPDEVIEKLIEKGEIFTQAGAFSPIDPLIKPYIQKIEGTEDSVLGLPKQLLLQLMKQVIFNQELPVQFYAGGFLYNPKGKTILLHKRDAEAPVNPSKWGFFGGTNEGQETPIECFLRELAEELDLHMRQEQVMALRDYYNPERSIWRYVFYIESDLPKNAMRLGEGADFEWIPIRSVFHYDLTSKTARDLQFFIENIVQ